MASQGKLKNRKNKNLLGSIKVATIGILYVIKKEIKIQYACLITIAVIAMAFLTKVSTIEWIILIMLCGTVISLEMINTALEDTVDMAMPNIHPLAKLAKDISAGSVFLFCITSAIIGFIIFIPKIIEWF